MVKNTDYILGIACNGTDNAACLFENGQLFCAVEEERFTRIKHEGRFPIQSIRWCLEFANVNPDAIGGIAISWDYPRYSLSKNDKNSIHNFYRSLEIEGYPINWALYNKHANKFQQNLIINAFMKEFMHVPILFFRHHECHAASSYCYSGFDRSLVLVMDEKGENICYSLYHGKANYLELIESFSVPHSLGLYYAAATQFLKYTPFRDEGTFMALATTGNHNEALWSFLLKEVINITKGIISINPIYISKNIFNYPRINSSFYTRHMINKLNKIGLYCPNELGSLDTSHKDFAFTIQEVLEYVVINYLKNKLKIYNENKLCISGGVGLNCSLNGKIINNDLINSKIKKIFIPPWCHDAGGAIGAALLAYNNNPLSFKKIVPKFDQLQRADWGPAYSQNRIFGILKAKGLHYVNSNNIAKEAAEYLANKKILAWYQGRIEFGPRALGQRSILSHPNLNENLNRLQKIKKRLKFRPFAPSILSEYESNYFINSSSNTNFMTTSFPITDSSFKHIPIAINRFNNTVRPQSVIKLDKWLYRKLIMEFYKLTNIPAILNTSFNINEPLVLTPNDAISTFLNSKIDILVLGKLIIKNPCL